jgi:uncharacterized membrane protein YkoI
MLNRVTLPAALVAALGFGAVPALAATTSQVATPDVAGFQHAKISLDQAITAAEKASGGKTIDASFQMMNGKSGYAVTVLANSKMKDFWVDPQSGVATPQTKLTTAELNQQAMDKAGFSAVHSAKETLPQAIALAEQHSGGKAIDAMIEKRDSKLAYDIQVVKGGKLNSVWVDPASGQVST